MKREKWRQIRRSTLTLALSLSFLLGVGAARLGTIPGGMWLLVLPGALLTWRRRSARTLLWCIALGLLLGWGRGSWQAGRLSTYQHYYGQKVSITAVAMQDGVYNKYQQTTVDARSVMVPRTGERLPGKISLGGYGLNAIFAGDELEATGKLLPSLGSYQGRMSYAQLTLVRHHNTLVTELRRRFTAGVQSALPEPLASFGMGLLIGQRNTLPPAVSQSLLMVGLTHIIAVSGYNLTILLRATDRMGGKQSKRLAAGSSLLLIGVFLLFAGTGASIVRAAIVSLLSVGAKYYGREFRPVVLLLLAAAITAYANPSYVWTDTSWYLSFLAFYGVMVLAPSVRTRLPGRVKESLVLSVALESLCAEVMTLPFVLHTFGQMSLVGLPANVLVAVLVPLAMLLTLTAGMAGMMLPALAGWLAWPARMVLTYMLDIASLLSRLPHVFAQNLSFGSIQMLFCYALLMAISGSLVFKSKAKNANITGRTTAKQHATGNALQADAHAL